MKTISYQIERQTPKGKWETLAPTIHDKCIGEVPNSAEDEAITLLNAQRINARESKSGAQFRLVKTTRSVVRA
ncbi:MAG: hypothetical protein HZA88_00445 [Verrucomicrobia bacterium]|nr:hypothetical protein [Verrucomicrobiota bacterium]